MGGKSELKSQMEDEENFDNCPFVIKKAKKDGLSLIVNLEPNKLDLEIHNNQNINPNVHL